MFSFRFKRTLRLFLFCSGGLLLAQNASADLIGAFTHRGTSGSGPSQVTTTGVGFAMRFGNPQDGICIGCFPYAAPGSGTFDFTRANSPAFDAFVGRLTDTQNEVLSVHFNRYRSDGLVDGGGGGNREQTWFGTLLTPDLVASIDSIRLTYDLSYQPLAGGAFTASYVATWQFFGTPGPQFNGPYVFSPPNSVPEPATLGMMVVALGFAAAARRRLSA